MPLATRWTDQNLGIVVEATGVFLDEEVIRVNTEFLSDPRQLKLRYHLLDTTAATKIHFSTENVKRCVEQANRAFIANPAEIIAIVTPSELGYGLARMWQIYLSLSGIRSETNIFRERELAEQWIREVTGEEWFRFQ